MEEIEFSGWIFEGRLRQGKNVLRDGLNWLCYFKGSSKRHHENSISFIFLGSPHQVDMKNIVKSSKHFFGYFNTLENHSDLAQIFEAFLENLTCTKTHLPKRKGSLPIFSWIYIQHLVLGGVNQTILNSKFFQSGLKSDVLAGKGVGNLRSNFFIWPCHHKNEPNQ